MGELKLKSMSLVKDLETEEEFDVLRDFLLTDPKNVTHSIAFWKQELISADAVEKAEIEDIIKMLKNTLKLQARITARVYSISTDEETKETVVETVASQNVDKPIVNPADVKLHIVKDKEIVVETDEKRILRVKYEKLIKNINFEALKLKVTELLTNTETVDEAKEMATFFLSEGLYQGKKVKKWDQEAINKFIENCANPSKPKENKEKADIGTGKEKSEPVQTTTEAPAADEDLYKKYACYLGDNKSTLSGIKAEVKFLMNEGDIEKAMEVAAFLLGAGEYVDSKPEKWSEQQIIEFITSIKEDLKVNPLDLNPEGAKGASEEALTDVSHVNPEEEVVKEYDLRIDKFYMEIENKILTEDIDPTAIKQYIFDTIKSKKIETLEMFHNTESTSEELESMYTTFFNSFITIKYQEKNNKNIDVKAEIEKQIGLAIEAKESGFTKIIKSAMDFYKLRGEKVSAKEAREIVHSVAKEKYLDFYNKVIETLGESNKIAIVQETENFQQKHPTIWEEVKDAKCLDDVYTMARELEKSQSFLVVSEMITHLISSGKINDKEGNPVKWDKAAIELWINSMFNKAETVTETETKEVETNVETVIEQPETVKEENPTVEVVSPETTGTESTEETGGLNTEQQETQTEQTEQSTSATETVEEQSSAPNVQETTVESSNIKYPNGLKIPEGDEKFKELYASNSEGFWEGFVNNINRLTTEKMSKKEITHILADKVKEIANNKDLTQCHARNFKRTDVTQMYKAFNKKAAALGIPGWEIE